MGNPHGLEGAMTVGDMRRQYDKASASYSLVQRQHTVAMKKQHTLQELTLDIEEALVVLQTVARETQEQIKYELKDIVDEGLNTVFPGKYTSDLEFETKYDRTEARPVLWSGKNCMDPTYNNGGGVGDILSFAYRLALLVISKNDKVLILDEPMKFVSVDLRESVYSILKDLSTDLGVQIIMSSHDDHAIAIADKVFSFEWREGISYVN